MNASSALSANSRPTLRGVAGPTMLNAPGPSLGRGHRSMTGMSRLCATARLAESMSGHVNSAETRKSSK